MATFVSRAEWGARPPVSRSTNITPENGGVTVHHVDDVHVARSSHSSCAGQVRGIQDYHMDSHGWVDIAYTYLVCVHGYVFEGRGPGYRTAANGTTSGNQNWYAVCGLVGGTSSDYDDVTDGLIDAFQWSVSYLRSSGGAGSGINRHLDHKSTECPGSLSDYVVNGAMEPGNWPLAWPGRYLSYPPVTDHSSVRIWQQQMRNRGWSMGVDGRYGPESKGVCESFQQQQGLSVDGVVGPNTWSLSFG